MSALDEFLGLGNVKNIQETITVNVSGKDYSLKIRALTADEHSEFQKRATTVTKKSVSFDSGKYDSLVIPACIVEPDFNNADFLDKAKCVNAWEFICSRFPSGTVTEISNKIQQLSGFKPLEMEIEEAKN